MEELIIKSKAEYYDVKTDDDELHVINVMLESLQRHLHNKCEGTSKDYELKLKEQRERVVRYVLGRVVSYKCKG